MPQLHCYVPEAVAQKLQLHAAQLGMSVSGYLAALVKRDVNVGWPQGYELALFGPQIERSPLAHESGGLAEERISLL